MRQGDTNMTAMPHVATDDTPLQTSEVRQEIQGRIGFVGLGRMGRVMAANLAAGGRRVTAYIRHPEGTEELAALGLHPSLDIEDLFECDIVISMLPDDAAVHNIVFGRNDELGLDGLAANLMPGAMHVSMSTISTAAAGRFAREHKRCNQHYIAAPVFGNPDAAKARELFIIAAGEAEQVDRARPIFDLLGQQTFYVGADPASANLVKLAGNVMTATALEMLGEVLSLVRKRGLDAEMFLNILTSTLFGGRVHKIYGAKIAAQRYAASGFVFPLALKDVRLALAEAEAASVPMPSVSVVRDRLITGIARGYADLDWSALGLVAAQEAGLTVNVEAERNAIPT
jgi:3-hydroxyisobutyrate dehydrogenase-like beta-hydroxyacid dehydrogenase